MVLMTFLKYVNNEYDDSINNQVFLNNYVYITCSGLVWRIVFILNKVDK